MKKTLIVVLLLALALILVACHAYKKHKNPISPKYFYSEKDEAAYEKMITEQIGPFDEVLHELVSPDLHIDILPIPPAEGRDYLTLVTMGMGAYPMPVPAEYGKFNRAELAIRLPADWDYHSDKEEWYWPIRTLKTLARMPYRQSTWLGLYHDVDFEEPFSPETGLCGVLLDFYDPDLEPLTLENGDRVILYNVIPLYRAEIDYKLAHEAAALLEMLPPETVSGPVDVHRPCAVPPDGGKEGLST